MIKNPANLRNSAASIALFLIVAAQSHGQTPADLAKPVATVNGEPITRADVEALRTVRPQTVPITKKQELAIQNALVEVLIDDLLLHQFLRKNAPPISQEEVDREWNELKNALAKKGESLAEFLRESKQTEAQLRGDIIARVQWRAFLKKSFPDANVQAYYQANKYFFDKTLVQASHILAPAGSPAEKEKARQKLEFIRQEILASKITFADAARQYSSCPSAKEGGNIGKFPYKFVVVEPFARAAFAMKKGEMSGVVETEIGMHLIHVTDRIEGQPSDLNAIRETVRETMAQEQNLYKNILAEQRRAADIKMFPQ